MRSPETNGSEMPLSPIGYYCDFVVYPLLIAALAASGLVEAGLSGATQWIVTCGFFIGLWTLIEYWLHRVVFHRFPLIRDLHHDHHLNETASRGTPSWLSLSAHGLLVLLPLWLLINFEIASAVSSGLMIGYLWYVCIHHILHHWHPPHAGYVYRLKQRHALHHHIDGDGNFGVTTGIWDRVFGSATARRSETRSPRL